MRFDIDKLPERVKQNIEVTDTCWLWHGPQNGGGYPYMSLEGRVTYIPFLVFEHLTGTEIEKRTHLWRSCENPLCVNPAHLSPGAKPVNIREEATLRYNEEEDTYSASFRWLEVEGFEADDTLDMLAWEWEWWQGILGPGETPKVSVEKR